MPAMPRSKTPRKPMNPHLQGLLGVLLGVLVVAVVLGLLRWRRDGVAVDPQELMLASRNTCITEAIQQATAGGHSITYGELDQLEKHCGS
jgi:hypothetical protein